MISNRVVLCSAHCKYNDGKNYYNICNHTEKNKILGYGGIDRIYTGGCEFKEKQKSEINMNDYVEIYIPAN